jgi:hypothetical protein
MKLGLIHPRGTFRITVKNWENKEVSRIITAPSHQDAARMVQGIKVSVEEVSSPIK